MTREFARVTTELPGPRSRAIVERERPLLAPGIQQISTLAGLSFARGHGAILEDADGNRFIDWVAGIGVASIGHGHPALSAAIAEQSARISVGSFASESRASLLERIAKMTSDAGLAALRRTQLYSGGAEAVESALRLARAYTKRTEIIAFDGGFHGKTAGVLGLMGSDFKNGLGPFPPGLHVAPYPGDPLQCLARLAELANDRTAAILLEPMQGTAGNLVPDPAFIRGVRDLACDRGALFIADEMITGFGRTGHYFASQHFGLAPDVITFGKGVAGGYPLSGLITTDEVARAEPWSRPSHSSSSFGGSPLACAAGDAVTRVIVEERLADRAREVGDALRAALDQVVENHRSLVTGARHRGLFIGVDLVGRDGKPLDRASCERLFRACLRRGLLTMAYAPRVRINPPLVITRAQALEGVAIFDEALTAFAEGRE